MKGLLQLIIYGTQDLFLTGNPHISHFKVLYRRHTLFSIEEKNIILRNKHKLGTTIKKEIPKQGDLLDNLLDDVRNHLLDDLLNYLLEAFLDYLHDD